MLSKYTILAIIALSGSSVTAIKVGMTGTGSVSPHEYESDCLDPVRAALPTRKCQIPTMFITNDGSDKDPQGESYICSGIAATNLIFSCGDCVKLTYNGE
jgi:hypothetical protein